MKIVKTVLVALAIALLGTMLASSAYADAIIGSADAFAVLGASTVTNTGATTLGGDLGVWPGTSLTGTGTITLSGAVHANDGVAHTAQTDALTGYNTLAAKPFLLVNNLTGMDLGTVGTLTAGVYHFSSSAQLTGALTLDFGGASNQNFIFKIGSTLTTASGSRVLIIGDTGSNNHVYWQVGSSATLGTTTAFAGDIIALTSVTMNTGATDGCGTVIALNAAVTLDHNTISTGCNISTGGGGTPVGTVTPTVIGKTTTVTVPEPGTLLLLGCGMMGLVAFKRS
jgi:hypothetical protein